MSDSISPISVPNNPHFQPIEHGKVKRVILELFFKIVCNFWRSLASYFGKVSFDVPVPELEGNAPIALSEFKHKQTLGTSAIMEYTEQVLKNEYDELEVVTSSLFGCDTQLEKSEKSMVFVPVVLHGRIRNHIVAVLYDKTNNRVELFDPKGLVAKDHRDPYLMNLLAGVREAYGDDQTTLWENTAKHQRDSHNCGVYVLDYLQRRLEGETPEEIAGNRLSFKDANNTRRKQFIESYLGKLSS